MKTISDSPHYEIPSRVLADWLEAQGNYRWWFVDGDPLLTGNIAFPCPADELVEELRKVDRPLLAQAKKTDIGAKGQQLGLGDIGKVVDRLKENMHSNGTLPEWADDRVIHLGWKGSPHEWLLAEDGATTKMYSNEELATSK